MPLNASSISGSFHANEGLGFSPKRAPPLLRCAKLASLTNLKRVLFSSLFCASFTLCRGVLFPVSARDSMDRRAMPAPVDRDQPALGMPMPHCSLSPQAGSNVGHWLMNVPMASCGHQGDGTGPSEDFILSAWDGHDPLRLLLAFLLLMKCLTNLMDMMSQLSPQALVDGLLWLLLSFIFSFCSFFSGLGPVVKIERVKDRHQIQSAAPATKSARRSKTAPIPCACHEK